MDGTFRYTALRKRLDAVFQKITDETLSWAITGREAVRRDLSIASNLRTQHEQVLEAYKRNDTVTLDLNLVDNNPFEWELILFGRPMTNLDGGVFRIVIRLSPDFPEEHPRVTVETPIFHHRVSPKGILCYNARRKDDMKSHIEAIIDAIEEEEPAYDPRTLVNVEAAKLLWGPPEDRKIYNRKLRRSVQESTE
jgi:ubiquitin-conjugating enzyme E2 Z